MPELTFSFDVPLEANHVLCEDTQAQLDEFRQMPWIKPDYKAVTLDAFRKVERYWRRYSPSATQVLSSLTAGQYINTHLRADHNIGVRPKPKHTMSP
jgi:hypothetical protein